MVLTIDGEFEQKKNISKLTGKNQNFEETNTEFNLEFSLNTYLEICSFKQDSPPTGHAENNSIQTSFAPLSLRVRGGGSRG